MKQFLIKIIKEKVSCLIKINPNPILVTLFCMWELWLSIKVPIIESVTNHRSYLQCFPLQMEFPKHNLKNLWKYGPFLWCHLLMLRLHSEALLFDGLISFATPLYFWYHLWSIYLVIPCSLISQAQFAQLRAPGAMAPALPSNLPGFHPGAPRLAPQPLYFGQGTPGLIPPQPAGYGFQQQLLPGIRSGVPPNFLMPYPLQRQGQPGQRMGVRRGGTPQQMQQQQVN